MTIDLNTCKPGDKLRIDSDRFSSCDIATYVGKSKFNGFGDLHEIRHHDGVTSMRRNNGKMLTSPGYLDVIEIIGQ